MVNIGNSCEHCGAAMTLSELVPSLDLCQQLQAAGFPQDTALAWYPTREVGAVGGTVWVVDAMSTDMLCAAPTAEEILRELPLFLDKGRHEQLSVTKEDAFPDGDKRNGYVVDWWNNEIHGTMGGIGNKSLAEAAAHAYLWWKKEVAG